MIQSEFYHTGETTINGMLVTDDIQTCADITDVTGDYARPYYMGYLDYGTAPAAMRMFAVEYDNTGNTSLTFTETDIRNRAWGYAVSDTVNSEPQGGYVYTENSVITYSGTNSYLRFINAVDMCNVAYSNECTLRFISVAVPEADLDDNDSAYNRPANVPTGVYTLFHDSVTMNIASGLNSLKDFLYFQTPISFTHTIAGVSTTFSILYEDMDEDAPIWKKTVEINGVNYVIFTICSSFSYPEYNKYIDGNDLTVYGPCGVIPFVEYDEPDDGHDGTKMYAFNVSRANDEYIRLTLEYRFGNQITACTLSNNMSSSNKWTVGGYYIAGDEIYGTDDAHPEDSWWYRTSTQGESTNAGNYPAWGRRGIIRGRHIFEGESDSTGTTRIYKMLDPEDIYKIISLFHKIDSGGNTYANVTPIVNYTVFYPTSLFDEDNLPYYTRDSGNTSDVAFMTRLRDWQKPNTDIAENDFNVDDMPEYDPNPHPDDDARGAKDGDVIHTNIGGIGDTGNFVTNWVMDSAGVREFGEFLWKNLLDLTGYDPSDPNYNIPAGIWNNLMVAWKTYYQTGSFDPASVLEMIVGVRYYPFDVETACGLTAATLSPAVYFGVGKYGVDISPNKANVLPYMANGFRVGTWQCKDFKPYKDWRDYEGSTAVIYIPFCGSYQIPIADIIPDEGLDSSYVELWYGVDYASGTCTAILDGVYPTRAGNTTRYPIVTAQGQIGFEVPITATNANRITAALVGNIQNGIGHISSAVGESVSAVYGATQEDAPKGFGTGGGSEGSGVEAAVLGSFGDTSSFGFGGKLKGALRNTAIGFLNSPATQVPCLQSGHGWAATQMSIEPFIQIRRGRYIKPKNYNHTLGVPNATMRLVAEIGKGKYATAVNVDTTGLDCTNEEKQMIKALLESGFYA